MTLYRLPEKLDRSPFFLTSNGTYVSNDKRLKNYFYVSVYLIGFVVQDAVLIGVISLLKRLPYLMFSSY